MILQFKCSRRSTGIHHSLANNIGNNSLNVHPPLSPPVQPYNNSHVTAPQSQAVNQALNQTDGVSNSGGQAPQSQPVDFNHAIDYVNKIKVRLVRRSKANNIFKFVFLI